MYGTIPVPPRRLEEYQPIVGDEQVEEIRTLADPFKGARVLELNATAFGTSVSDLIGSQVALLKGLGIKAEWQVIRHSEGLFRVSRAMHNGLQGLFTPWTSEMRDLWLKHNCQNAELFDESFDFVIIHDHHVLAIPYLLRQCRGEELVSRWIWRCHHDLSLAQLDIWDFLRPYLEAYHATVFTMQSYARDDLHGPQVAAIPPAIDPLNSKNMDIPPSLSRDILSSNGIDLSRPYIGQVSRFDLWMDPMGTIDTYRLVKKEFPDLQLVLVANMAADDPEEWSYYERVARRAASDPDIHLLCNLQGIGHTGINAVQRAARVVVHKSLREGFGLAVAEALWKAKPVVAGNVTGIRLQIFDGQTGFLASTINQAARKILELLEEPEKAEAMGQAGREHVRENFLCTRYLRDFLVLFRNLS
jgi:trehalose synthase